MNIGLIGLTEILSSLLKKKLNLKKLIKNVLKKPKTNYLNYLYKNY